MRYFSAILGLALLVPLGPAWADMKLFGAGDAVAVKEIPGDANTTMAGTQSFMTRTDRLFAAFLLLNTEEKERSIKQSLLQIPISQGSGNA